MATGIHNASVTAFVDGTTADGPTVSSNDLSLKTNGVDNNGGLLSDDGAGTYTAVGFRTTGGGLLAYIISPYHLLSSTTINSGTTNTPTCTGVGGIPSGAKAVLINFAFTPSTGGTYATFTPHGTAWGAANYPVSQLSNGTSVVTGSFWVVLDGSGKLDITANAGNCTSMDVQIIGYIY